MTHCAVPTSTLKSSSIAGRATFSAVKSLAITITPRPIAIRATAVPGSIRSASRAAAVRHESSSANSRGSLVQMPSTPRATSRFISRGSSTVQAINSRPTSWQARARRGVITGS